MKKILFLVSIIASLAACQKSISVSERIANDAPIMPNIVLTDYLPALYGDTNLWKGLQWTTGDGIECLNLVGSAQLVYEMDIVNHNRSIHAISFQDKKGSFAIPVLPNKPVRQALISLGYENDVLRFGFYDEVANPSIEAYIQNRLIDHTLLHAEEDGTWTLDMKELKIKNEELKGRSYLRIFAEDENYLFNDILLPLQDGKIVTDASQLDRHDPQTQILYSVLIDRFYNGNPSNDWKMNSPEVLDIVDYQGGDLAGITQKISEGYFEQLGVNTLWISPITQNPWDAWGCYPFKNGNKYDPTKTYTKFSGYHGYWPIYATQLEQRFGTPDELRTLLDSAHAHGINVVLDYVANHMHINSPTLQQHPDWHTDSILPDGRRNFELWDDARLTTWFDKHIPTLDLERTEVCEQMTDSALYWLENYDLDGFRHDACKHIPEGYWRLLEQKIARRFPGRHIWMIGETYGSPQLIGSYVKTGMLNAQFDFNLYWTLRNALINGDSFETINATVLESMAAYGSHHTMGCISGNHDQIRFASLADGAIRDGDDKNGGKETGWTRDVRPATELAYTRAMQLEVLNMTLPGVPCIYQGDEYAEIGANDPDNRHMMRFEGLNEQEEAFRQKVKTMIDLRRHSMALTYGEYIPVEVSHDTLVFDRVYLNETVRVKIIRDGISEIETYIEPLSR